MKKKVKLITTIASLGLALALMAFGVYAATSATFNVSTTVTFQATQHVKVTVTGLETAALTAAPQASDYVTAPTNNGQSLNRTETGADQGALADMVFTGVTLTETNYIYSYKITIQNDDAENAVAVKFTVPAAPAADAGYTVAWDGEEATSIPAANTQNDSDCVTVTCTVTVTRRNGTAVAVDSSLLTLGVVLGENAKPAQPGA